MDEDSDNQEPRDENHSENKKGMDQNQQKQRKNTDSNKFFNSGERMSQAIRRVTPGLSPETEDWKAEEDPPPTCHRRK